MLLMEICEKQKRQKQIVMRKTNKTRYGIFYRSNGRWTSTPYAGFTFTKYTMNRQPLKEDLATLRNYVLKSRVQVLPVA